MAGSGQAGAVTPLVIAFMQGDTSAEALSEVRARLLQWTAQRDEDPIHLNRMLGLGSPLRTRIALRDAHLVQAAELLTGSRWSRCKALAELARTFNARRYDSWKRAGIPAKAGEVDVLLFHACEIAGAPLPQTSEQYLNIIPVPV